MTFDPETHHRHSVRLTAYSYTDGAYFVTICSRERACILGEVVGEVVRLSAMGEIAQACWYEIPHHFKSAELDAFVVMPNHVHGIVFIHGNGAQHAAPLHNVVPGSLAAIVRSFKAATSKKVNEISHGSGGSIWQRNYYEYVIRDEKSLNVLREYILFNPAKWAEDRENPIRG